MENRSSAENNRDAMWDSFRKKKFDDSFPGVSDWIRETHKSIGKSRLKKRKNRRRLTFLAMVLFPIFIIVSCTYRIDRVEKLGSLVNFSIDKQENESFQKLSSLQKMFSFSFLEFSQPTEPGLASFIFFIHGKEKEKLQSITRRLRLLKGLQKLDISPVDYTIRESLFLTFLHKTLQLGRDQEPKGKELTSKIQTALKNKGLGFLSANIIDGNGSNIEFTSAAQNPDSLVITNTVVSTEDDKKPQQVKTSNTPALKEKLQIFNWLIGSWKVIYVPTPTYHHWLRVNDSLLICFIIKNYDDEPDISVGFSIRYSEADSAILSLRDIKWRFLSADDKEFNFKNETTPKSANVKWSLGNEKKTWQSVISGEKNLEIVNLIRDENNYLENIVKDFILQHPELGNKQ